MRISEDKASIQSAKELCFKCNLCGKLAYAIFPYKPTALQRLQAMKAALDEHRQVCTAANSEEGRTFEIWYPRKDW